MRKKNIYIRFKGYTLFTATTNIGYIPSVVQYIIVAYLTSNSLYLLLPHLYIDPSPTTWVKDSHWFPDPNRAPPNLAQQEPYIIILDS